MSAIADSREAYEEKKKELTDQGRWVELLYDQREFGLVNNRIMKKWITYRTG